MKKNKMNYGDNDKLSAEDLDLGNAKIRITTMIDKAVYDAIKADAKATGRKYQTLLNNILLKHYFSPKESTESKAWENEIGRIKKRLAALEKEKTA